MILDFHASEIVPAAKLLLGGMASAIQHQSVTERLEEGRKYQKAPGLPECVTSLLDVGLFSANTRNASMVNLILMMKSVGVPREIIQEQMEDWAAGIPEHLTNTRKRERVNAVRDTLRWAFNKDGSSGNCTLIRGCGASCPGEKQCAFVDMGSEEPARSVRVSLSEACTPQFAERRISFKGVPVAVDQRPQLVPKQVEVSCSPKDCDACEGCRLREAKGTSLKLTPRQVLKLSSLPEEDRFAGVFTRWARIPKRCPGYRTRVISQHPLLLTLIQPSINGTAEALRENKVFFMGAELDDQVPYEFEGYTFAHPKNHEAVQVATSARPLAEGFRSFTPPDGLRERLSPFQPDDWGIGSVQQQIADTQQDWQHHVHQIYGRELHALMMSLPWFSPLEMVFGGRKQRAWLEVLAFGDTGQGKSEIAQRFLDFFGQGTMVTGKNLSVAGLLAGVDRVDGRHVVRKGIMPRYDGSLVAIDEYSAMTEEAARSMTDKRSSGVARISKIVAAEFHARNRLLLLANPVIGKNRKSCAMDEMPFGIQHVLPLMRSPEDARRLDYVIGFRSSQRVFQEIHKERPTPPPPVYTQELAQLLILWIWSRTAEQVIFDPEAETACSTVSEILSGDHGYSRSIPLLMAGDTRHKVARVATCLAGMTFSTDDGITLRVRAVHVDLAYQLLLSLYNGPELQFDLFSQADPAHQLLTWEVFQQTCMEVPRYGTVDVLTPDGRMVTEQRWQSATNSLLASAFMTERDLKTMSGLKETGEFLAVLTRRGLLEKNVSGFKLNGRGVRVAKLMLRWAQEGNSLLEVEEAWFNQHKDEV